MSVSPSITLSASFWRGALSRPWLSACCAASILQRRHTSATSRLTKLHRRQKAALRDERAQSELRAHLVTPPAIKSESIASTDMGAGDEIQRRLANKSIESSLPYHIARTPSSNLPVYRLSKAGGSKHLTLIRKITGDLAALKADLIAALPPLLSAEQLENAAYIPSPSTSEQLETTAPSSENVSKRAAKRAERIAKKVDTANQVTINSTTGNIAVKGWRKAEIEKFLDDRGF